MLRALDAAAAARRRGVCVAPRSGSPRTWPCPPTADEEEEAAAPARAPRRRRRRTSAPNAPPRARRGSRAALRLLAASAATTSRVETLIETIRSWLKRVFHETSPKSALARALPATPSSLTSPVPRGAGEGRVTSAAAAAARGGGGGRAARAFFADASAVSDPLPLARVKARVRGRDAGVRAGDARVARAPRVRGGTRGGRRGSPTPTPTPMDEDSATCRRSAPTRRRR